MLYKLTCFVDVDMHSYTYFEHEKPAGQTMISCHTVALGNGKGERNRAFLIKVEKKTE